MESMEPKSPPQLNNTLFVDPQNSYRTGLGYVQPRLSPLLNNVLVRYIKHVFVASNICHHLDSMKIALASLRQKANNVYCRGTAGPIGDSRLTPTQQYINITELTTLDVSSTPAKDRVLCVLELLEGILLKLDQKTLLVSALRVCRGWKDLIVKSPSLQRHLFLEPDSKAFPVHNPLLARHFPYLFQHAESADNVADPISLTSYKMMDSDLDFPSMPWLENNRAAYQYPDASWKRMLVHQPPLHSLGWLITHHGLWCIGARHLSGRRPLMMPALIYESLGHIHTGGGAAGHLHLIAKSSFRVLWRQLPADIRGPHEGSPKDDEDEDEDNDTNDESMAGVDDQVSPVYINHRQQMDRYGIVVHVETCVHSISHLDTRANVLWEILTSEDDDLDPDELDDHT
ncbi:hypothetical protein BJ170DRAFT_589849 [Xylariales sp. AK1849]|nr:hypothetical protein BJ170DRAFT_589849 [Xylariales sp. AK1849]